MKKTPKHPVFYLFNGIDFCLINDLKSYCERFDLNYDTVYSKLNRNEGFYSDDIRSIYRSYIKNVNECLF